MAKISIVIPCYFNEKNINPTLSRLLANESSFPAATIFEYIFVDDGSKDNTLKELLIQKNKYPEKIKVVKLAGNVGSYNAIVAGLEIGTGNCFSVISADLQDPPELITKMFTHWQNGIKFVVANRNNRDESFLKKRISNLFHSLIKKFALENIPEGGFDFVLFDEQLRDELLKIKEKNTNSLYLLAWMNYEMVSIPYNRQKREIGESKWTLKKKIKLFIDSFISFSYVPIRIITFLGISLGLISLTYALYVLYNKLSGNIDVSGYTSIMLVALFIGSFQMIALGILGEYLWRVLDASRNRPLYIIEKVYD